MRHITGAPEAWMQPNRNVTTCRDSRSAKQNEHVRWSFFVWTHFTKVGAIFFKPADVSDESLV